MATALRSPAIRSKEASMRFRSLSYGGLLMLTAIQARSFAQTIQVTATLVGTYQYGPDCANYLGQETLVLSGSSGAITGTVSDVVESPSTGADHGAVSGTVIGSTITLHSAYVSGASGTLTGAISGGTISGNITGICASGAKVSLSLTSFTATASGALPTATPGQAYNFALPASGPLGENIWSSSGLPPGFSIQDGSIVSSGSPAATPDTYNVSLTVTEAGATADAAVTLIVTNIKPTIVSITPPSASQGETIQNFVVNGSNFDPNAVVSFSAAGITVDSYSVETATQIIVNVIIAMNAALGNSDITVTNSSGQQGTLSSAFNVTAGIPPENQCTPIANGRWTCTVATGAGTPAQLPLPQLNPGDSVSMVATLFTDDPNEPNENENASLEIQEPGSVLPVSIPAGSYGFPTPLSFTVPKNSSAGFGVWIDNFDGDEFATFLIGINRTTLYPLEVKQDAAYLAKYYSTLTLSFDGAPALLKGCEATPLAPVCLVLSAGDNLLKALTLYYNQIAKDPPDPNFTQVVQPIVPTISPVTTQSGITQEVADAFNALYANYAHTLALTRAIAICLNRAQTADDMGFPAWMTAQVQAGALYSEQLSSVLAVQPTLLTSAATAWQNSGLPSITIAPSDVMNAQNQIAQNGFDPETVAALQQIGLSSSDIATLAQLEIGIDPNAAAGIFPDTLGAPNVLATVQTAAQNFTNVFSSVVMFSTFSSTAETSKHRFELVSNFTLSNGSKGFNPPAQEVVLALGSYSVTIPSHSFHMICRGSYAYEGIINGVRLEARIVANTTVPNSYAFTIEGHTSVDLSYPAVELAIGSDMGIGAVDRCVRPER